VAAALCARYGWTDADWFDRQVRRSLTSLERTGLVASELCSASPGSYQLVRMWRIADGAWRAAAPTERLAREPAGRAS
jgi:hypothetical protein